MTLDTTTNETTARKLYCTNPATGEAIGEVRVFNADEVKAAVASAAEAQRAWRQRSVKERAAALWQFCDLLARRAEDLADLLTLETGKNRLEALVHEVLVLADIISWQCKHAPRALEARTQHLHLLKHRVSRIRYVPRGVIGVISPWNYPLMLPFADISAAVLAGNGVVLKPSEHAPLIALKGKELWDESGLPRDLLQVVTGDGETGAALIDAGISKLAFTGGIQSGRRVAERCGRNLVECVLELGGKAPFIVCEDADLDRAAAAITWGGFANTGQACVSVERVLCHASVYDEVARRTVALTRQLRQGAPAEQETDVGALLLEPQPAYLAQLVDDALSKGARLAIGGKRLDRPGNFYAPTVLLDCTPDMRVMQEEIFGPLVPMMRVKDDAEAIAIANSLPFGLSSYVFSKDTKRAMRIAEQIEAGSVVINDVHSDIASPEVPFGGIKNSGWGKIHGFEGLRGMCNVQHISVNRAPLPSKSPFWFPYKRQDVGKALAGIRLLFNGSGPLGRLARWL